MNDERIRRFDIRWGIPRPADSQHNTSWRAAYTFFGRVTQGLLYTLFGGAAAVLAVGTFANFGVLVWPWTLIAAVVAILLVLFSLMEAVALAFPYYRVGRRESHGSQAWASADALKGAKMLEPRGATDAPGYIRIGYFAETFRRYTLVVPIEKMFGHMCLFGPPGSGKSKTFFMPIIRQWSRFGCVVALDTKGELYHFTGAYFRNVVRLDLEDPSQTDRVDLIGACAGNPELAADLAATIVGLDSKQQGGEDLFWTQAETALLKAIILYLAGRFPGAHPATVRSVLANFPGAELGVLLEESGDENVIQEWRTFAQARADLQGNIRIGLSTALESFANENAVRMCTPPTEAERRVGVKVLDFDRLREPGTGVFVVVAEGRATQYESVLSTIFGVVSAVLRRTGGERNAVPALVAVDEAGNIRMRHLSERVGVGRGLSVCYLLGYQGISQAYKQYTRDGANAILDSIRTFIFLPGLGYSTCEYASKVLSKTTTWSAQTVDSVGKAHDSERLTEIARNLMDPADVRQMLEHTEALLVSGSLPPARFGIPPCVTGGAIKFVEPYPTLLDVEVESLPAEPPPPASSQARAAVAGAGLSSADGALACEAAEAAHAPRGGGAAKNADAERRRYAISPSLFDKPDLGDAPGAQSGPAKEAARGEEGGDA